MAHAHPELTCGLPIGLEQPLRGLDVRGAALEPASHEKINPRGKSQSSRCQNKPRVQALIGWSLDVVAGVHLALLPVRRRERPCAENYTLVLRICVAASRSIGPCVATDMHDQSASRISGRTRAAVSAMCVRTLRMTVLKSAGNFTRDECHDLNAEKIQRVKCFMFARCGFVARG